MPKSQKQNQLIRERRKNEMIVAATTIFSHQYYQDVGIDTITKELKCSHGLFYHYFSSKEDIFLAVIDKAIKEVSASIDWKQCRELKGKEAIESATERILNILNSDNEYVIGATYLLLNLQLTASITPQLEVYKQQCIAATNWIYESFKEAQENNEIPPFDTNEYATSYIALLKGLLYDRLYAGKHLFVCPSKDIILKLLEV